MLSDKLPADLGYLYENVVAQMIASTGRELYYHIWDKPDSTHHYEVDFLLQDGAKISPFEVKSSARKNHESIDAFCEKYSKHVKDAYLFSQKDVSKDGSLKLKPVYFLPFVIDDIS